MTITVVDNCAVERELEALVFLDGSLLTPCVRNPDGSLLHKGDYEWDPGSGMPVVWRWSNGKKPTDSTLVLWREGVLSVYCCRDLKDTSNSGSYLAVLTARYLVSMGLEKTPFRGSYRPSVMATATVVKSPKAKPETPKDPSTSQEDPREKVIQPYLLSSEGRQQLIEKTVGILQRILKNSIQDVATSLDFVYYCRERLIQHGEDYDSRYIIHGDKYISIVNLLDECNRSR